MREMRVKDGVEVSYRRELIGRRDRDREREKERKETRDRREREREREERKTKETGYYSFSDNYL
jgi:hypothetical protein